MLEKQFIFKISMAEYEWVKQKAVENHVSAAEYIRQLIDQDILSKGEITHGSKNFPFWNNCLQRPQINSLRISFCPVFGYQTKINKNDKKQ